MEDDAASVPALELRRHGLAEGNGRDDWGGTVVEKHVNYEGRQPHPSPRPTCFPTHHCRQESQRLPIRMRYFPPRLPAPFPINTPALYHYSPKMAGVNNGWLLRAEKLFVISESPLSGVGRLKKF